MLKIKELLKMQNLNIDEKIEYIFLCISLIVITYLVSDDLLNMFNTYKEIILNIIK